MRSLGLLLIVAALAACGDRRSFDERYEDTSRELEAREKAIADNLSSNMADSAQPEPASKPDES